MTIQIIIPVHNRKGLTRNCLNSLKAQSFQNFVVYIVDDGSTDGTSAMLKNEFEGMLNIRLVHGDGNLWWAGGIKTGIDYSIQGDQDDDFMMTLNNDVTLFPGFLEEAVKLSHKYPDSFIGGISVDNGDNQKIVATGWRMVSWPFAYTKRVWWPGTLSDLLNEPEVIDVDFVPGTATIIPVHLVKKFGTVNPSILPHYHADSEYAYRLKKNGVPVLISRFLPIYHDVSSTGLISNIREKPGFLQVIWSFFSIKSGNCLLYKWNFAKACCPWWARVPFMCFDTIKVMIRSFGAMLVGNRIDNIRIWANHL